MLAELEVLVFIKAHDDLDSAAARVFGALGTVHTPAVMDDPEGVPFHEGAGLGFRASFYANSGEMEDLEFETYQYTLEISSVFSCPDLDAAELEPSLSEYYSRLLAFELNTETATEIFVESTEEAEVFEIRSYRANPQYLPDQGPTMPRAYVTETRLVERPFDEEWDEEGDEEFVDDEEESEEELTEIEDDLADVEESDRT